MKIFLSAFFLTRSVALLMLVSLLFLSGCSTTSQKTHIPEYFDRWEAHKTKISALKQWRIEGRIFIKAGKEGASSRFEWQQDNANYQIFFTAPFSQGNYQLTGSPENVSIRLPNNSLQSADDAETLLKKTLGFKLPVSGLIYWLRGIPDPADPDREIILDTNERLSTLEQAGWKIKITSYFLMGNHYLPKKLTMENQHLKLKLAIKQWTHP